MTTLRELTKKALADTAEIARQRTVAEVESILEFCRVYAERGESETTYNLPISPASRKILQEGPEQLKITYCGDVTADCWRVSWT